MVWGSKMADSSLINLTECRLDGWDKIIKQVIGSYHEKFIKNQKKKFKSVHTEKFQKIYYSDQIVSDSLSDVEGTNVCTKAH